MSPYYIGSVQAVLLADAITNPIVRLMDGGGNFKRHVLVPMSGTDERAKAFEEGTDWLLAERYTDLAKTVLSKFCFGKSKALSWAYIACCALTLFMLHLYLYYVSEHVFFGDFPTRLLVQCLGMFFQLLGG